LLGDISGLRGRAAGGGIGFVTAGRPCNTRVLLPNSDLTVSTWPEGKLTVSGNDNWEGKGFPCNSAWGELQKIFNIGLERVDRM